MIIEDRDLGLLAYVYQKTRDKGTKIQVNSYGKISLMTTDDKTLSVWRLDYLNSDSCEHDRIILEFRNIIREHKK